MEKLRQSPVHGSSPSRTCKTGPFCNYKSHIVDNMILLRDWYLIKSPNAHNGKRLAVGGILSKGDQDVKDFKSDTIIQRLHAFKLRTANGLIILLTGLIDGQRTFENGFPSEVLSYFQIGFPFTWDALAKEYISRDGTCSSSGHDKDVNEIHSVGRERCLRIFSDDEKWCKSDSATVPENHVPLQNPFARETEVKSGFFLKGPALHMGSNSMTFSPSDAWKSNGTLCKYKISSSESALGLGNIQKFDNDGKIAPYIGNKCVESCLDEVIMSQTFLGTPSNISIGISYDNRGMRPDHECQHVNNDKKESPSDKPSQMNSTGNEDCKSLPKSPECSGNMLKANTPIQNLGAGNDNVCKDPEVHNISGPEIMSATESGKVMPLATIFKLVHEGSVSTPAALIHKKALFQPGKGTPVDSKRVVFPGNSVGERFTDTAKLVIGGSTAGSNFETLKDENVESENDSLDQSPGKRTKTCQLGSSEELSQRDAQMKSETIKVTKKDASSVAPRAQRVTRSRTRLRSVEDLEKEVHNGCSGLKDGCNEDAAIPMGCPKDALSNMNGSTTGASEFGIGGKMMLGAGITRFRATSSSLSSQKKGKRGCSAQQGANGENVAVSLSCPLDAFLNMGGRTPNSSESGPGKSKDKMGLFAERFDSGQRFTRSRAMSSSLRCSQKEGDGDCHIQKGTSNTDFFISKSCFKQAACDRKSGPIEIGIGETKNQGCLDDKALDGGVLLSLFKTINYGTAKRKLQYGHATDINTQHARKHLSSTVGCDQIEGLVRQKSEVSDDLKELKHSGNENVVAGKKKKRKAHFQHARRPFIPSSNAEKSSVAGKALNLKMSSSGRLIVPPLAHWRNEQIVYDTEGGITCIFDGSQVIRRPGSTRSPNIVTRSRKRGGIIGPDIGGHCGS